MQDSSKTSYETGASQDNTPVIPLPNPGEGGPVHPGNTNGNIQDNTPVILLPNPGEGGPVYPGNMNNQGNNNVNNMLSNIIGINYFHTSQDQMYHADCVTVPVQEVDIYVF